MSKGLGGWIHTFAITETTTHKNGYTVYKITSIVFPRSVPEALTCVTVWKRFHDVKRLYRELFKRHKALQLRGHVPELKDKSFFKRFDPDIIQLRKEYILQLLDFTAQHPALYKSHPFLSFFENCYSPNNSPQHQKGNIEAICDNLDINFDSEISLIDPAKDKGKDGIITNLDQSEQTIIDETNTKDTRKSETLEDVTKILTPQISFDGDESDYIYEAAYEFSKAVQAEVNQEYQEAYERYKCGVDKLLSGSKDDSSEERRFIAKAKVQKYVSRAEEIFEKHLLNKGEKKTTLQLSIDTTDSESEEYLERPWNQLSIFKVMQIIDTVMQVQDVTDKSIYIMKAIEKPSSNSNAQSIFLPQGVPYMVRLMGFFQSETAIYLLLCQAKGGKLFDYIRTYTPTGNKTSLNDIFTEIESDSDKNENIAETSTHNSVANFDSGFIEMCNDYRNEGETAGLFKHVLEDVEKSLFSCSMEENKEQPLPLHSAMSKDIDVNELVSCSQKLLRCVSDTLEQSKKSNIAIKTDLSSNGEDLIKKLELHMSQNFKRSIKKLNVEKKVILPEASVKQWAKELLIAVETLHLKGVILGDLHPDNLLLGSMGQLLLSYFHQNEGSGSNLQLLIDTTALEGLYVAPERPLTIKSDCWSYGVILFELLTGYTFKSCHPAGLAAYFEVQYPDVEISVVAKDLLNSLLQCSPEQRFGIEKIKSHAFFEGTNWEDVAKNGVNSF